MRKSIIYSFLGFLGIIILINSIDFEREPTDLHELAKKQIHVGSFVLASKTLRIIRDEHPENIDNHFNYIINHFNIPYIRYAYNSQAIRDDKTIWNYYVELSHSLEINLADIGRFGRGLILAINNDGEEALKELKKVNNKALKYLNSTSGRIYFSKGQIDKAELCFREEIKNKGDLERAYGYLGTILFNQNRLSELKTELKNNKEAREFYPRFIKQVVYFKTFNPFRYGEVIFKGVFSKVNSWGFLAAILITGSWIMFLRKLDVFEKEKWIHIFLTLFLGMLFSFIVEPLTDINQMIFGFHLTYSSLNNFLYTVLGIGAIEELAKIIPLLIMIRYSKAINESFDYILYASVSALGFAFIENLIYITSDHLSIIHGRALMAAVLHMFCSSLIAYGIILNKYKWHKNPYKVFFIFFFLAALAHGFYDFWLIDEKMNNFSWITMVFLLVCIVLWNKFNINALNQSVFFDKTKLINVGKLYDYLIYSLVGIMAFEYIVVALQDTAEFANDALLGSVAQGGFLIFFLSSSLSKIDLSPTNWKKINLHTFFAKSKGRPIYKNLEGKPIFLSKITQNEYTSACLPSTGKIYRNIVVDEDEDWFILHLDKWFVLQLKNTKFRGFYTNKVVIRKKEKFNAGYYYGEMEVERLRHVYQGIVALYLIPTETSLENKQLSKTNFVFAGWAKSNSV